MPSPMDPQNLSFPVKGLHEGVGFDMQPEDTSPDELNVRSFDPILDRLRGGSRPGMEKWTTYPLQVNGDAPIQLIQQVVRSIVQATDSKYLAGHGTAQSPASAYPSPSYPGVTKYNSVVQNVTAPEPDNVPSTYERGYVTSMVTDPAGNIYLAVTLYDDTGPDILYDAYVVKTDSSGAVLWVTSPGHAFVDDHTVPIEWVLAFGLPATADPDSGVAVYAGGRPIKVDGGGTKNNLHVIDTATGAWQTTLGHLTTADYTIDAITILPMYNDGGGPGHFQDRFVVSQHSDTSNAGDHVLLCSVNVHAAAFVLDSWNSNSLSSGFRLGIHWNGTYLTVGCSRSNNSWQGAGPESNIWRFTISGNVDTLVFDSSYRIGATSSDSPVGVGIPAVGSSDDGTQIVFSGERIAGLTTTKFNTSDSSVVWTQNLGGRTGEENLWKMDLKSSAFLMGGVRSINWHGSLNKPAALWYVDFKTGEILWHKDPAVQDARPISTDTQGKAGRVFSVLVLGSGDVPAIRETALLPVADGTIRKIDEQGSIETPMGGADALSEDMHTIQTATAFNNAFFIDGTNNKAYDLNTDVITNWVATLGTLPEGMRLLTLWRGRLVGSGVAIDPHNWFMSASGNPFNYDYSPATPNALQAVAGNNADAGLVGDIVTGLMPMTDDILVFGADHTLHKMTGDPAAGGVIDLLSDQTGMAFGKAWTKDPEGTGYFVGTDGIYRLMKDGTLENMTLGRWSKRFASIDLSKYRAYMIWDYARHALIVEFMSLTGGPNVSWVWEKRADAWHPQEYPETFGPTAMLAYDGPHANDKVTMFGCKDGYLRVVKSGVNDDGFTVSSRVRFAPFIAPNRSAEVVLNSVRPILADGAESSFIKVYTGQSAEACSKAVNPRVRRTLEHAGRNHSMRQKVRGYAVQLEVTSNGEWGLEGLAVGFEASGMPRREVRSTQ